MKRRMSSFMVLLFTLFFFASIFAGDATADMIDEIKVELESNNWKTRLSAVEKLKGIKDERAFKLLLEIADTSVEYWPIKIKAMLLLGEIGNPKAIELLLKVFNDAFLNSECPSIKSHAAIALGHFNKDKRVVDALITGINDGEVLTREASVNSLGKIGNPKAVPFLIPALNDKSFAVRLSAVRALGKIGDPQAIPYLQKIADSDNDPYMKNEAISALKEMRR